MAIQIRNIEIKNKVMGAVGSSPSVMPSLWIEAKSNRQRKQDGRHHLCAVDPGTCDGSHICAAPFMFVF